jgi:hypothetical protein
MVKAGIAFLLGILISIGSRCWKRGDRRFSQGFDCGQIRRTATSITCDKVRLRNYRLM